MKEGRKIPKGQPMNAIHRQNIYEQKDNEIG